ncbi:MAG: hypothetical protein J6W64_06120 [Bacilli bacterium]|nr:hypothetical protein [Bacilli bacterium]
MKKGIITILLVIASIMFVSPINTFALDKDSISIVDKSSSNLISNTISIAKSCPPTNAVLGDVDCEDSVAWLIQMILNVVKVIGPILVVILSSVDFIMVIVNSDNDKFQKAQKKLITRLVLAALLFLVPVIVQVLLQVFGITGNATGGIQ